MIHRLTIDAFAVLPETLAMLEEAHTSQKLAKCRMTVQAGGLPAAIAHYADHGTPQLVIVEEEAADQLLAHLDQLADVCAANTRVMVIGGRNDIQLYRALLARGISEYLSRPVTAAQLVDGVTALFSDSRTAPRGRVLAFWGARGGVGSSCLAQNTAWQLGQYLHESVVYIDLDLCFGTSLPAFDLDAKQTVADALLHPERLDEVLMERCMIDYDECLQILAAPGDCRSDVAVTPEAIEVLVDLAQRLASVVVIDLPHLWTDWTKQCLIAADEVVITAQADFASVRDCKTLHAFLSSGRHGAASAKLVLNKVDCCKKTELTAKDFAEAGKLVPQLTIPFEPALFGEAANAGQMIGEIGKTHRVNQSLQQLARSVAGKTPAAGKPAAKWGGGVRQWLRG